jgi:hypothetical protein
MYTYVHLCTPAIPDTPLNTLYTPLHDRYKDGSPKALCRRDKSVLSIALPAKTTEERLMRTTECLGVYIGTVQEIRTVCYHWQTSNTPPYTPPYTSQTH